MTKFIIIILAVLIISIIGFILSKKKNKIEEERPNDVILTSMDKERLAFQKTQIKIDFLKDSLINIIKQVEQSFYTLDNSNINNLLIEDDLKKKIIDEIEREINIGITKKLNIYKVIEDKFKSFQDNRMMYAVSKIDLEIPFFVDYLYYHSTTGEQHIIKYYTKKFEFINIKNAWYLNNIKDEQLLNIEDYFAYLENKKNNHAFK